MTEIMYGVLYVTLLKIAEICPGEGTDIWYMGKYIEIKQTFLSENILVWAQKCNFYFFSNFIPVPLFEYSACLIPNGPVTTRDLSVTKYYNSVGPLGVSLPRPHYDLKWFIQRSEGDCGVSASHRVFSAVCETEHFVPERLDDTRNHFPGPGVS